MWTIERIEALGFSLVTEHNKWCHFSGHGVDLTINLDTTKVAGNHFNFKSQGGVHVGHFRGKIETEEEMKIIIKCLLK